MYRQVAGKIVGMILSLPDSDFYSCVSSLEIFALKVQEAHGLIKQHQQQPQMKSFSSASSQRNQNNNGQQQNITNEGIQSESMVSNSSGKSNISHNTV